MCCKLTALYNIVILCCACNFACVYRRVLKNREEVPKPLLLEEKELVHSTDGKKISVHSSKGLAIGEVLAVTIYACASCSWWLLHCAPS